MSAPEQVFPRPAGGSSPAAGGSGGAFKLGKLRVGQRETMIGGAVVVAGLALFTRSRKGGDVALEESDAAPSVPASSYEIDTSRTDFYNELQPELEAIGDGLGELLERTPRTAAPSPRPKPPAPKPKAKPKKKKPKKNTKKRRPDKHPRNLGRGRGGPRRPRNPR